jgi:hypothetical protein
MQIVNDGFVSAMQQVSLFLFALVILSHANKTIHSTKHKELLSYYRQMKIYPHSRSPTVKLAYTDTA